MLALLKEDNMVEDGMVAKFVMNIVKILMQDGVDGTRKSQLVEVIKFCAYFCLNLHVFFQPLMTMIN